MNNTNLDNIKRELENEKNIFLTLSRRIPQVYSQYKVNPISEYEQNYNSLQKQLDESSSKLFLIKNKILKMTDNLAIDMLEKDQYISTAEKTKEQKQEFIQELEGKGKASQPRETQIQDMYYVEFSLLAIQTFFLLGYGYAFYEIFKN